MGIFSGIKHAVSPPRRVDTAAILKAQQAAREAEAAAKKAAEEAQRQKDLADGMKECMLIESGNCNKGQLCPNYLSKDRTSKCQSFIEFLEESPGDAMALEFDRAKDALCKQDAYKNFYFCSCLARQDPTSHWNQGPEGYQMYFDSLLPPKLADQCWYKYCTLAADDEYGLSSAIATKGALTRKVARGGQECPAPKCAFNISAFGDSAPVYGEIKQSCEVNESKTTNNPSTPTSTPAKNKIKPTTVAAFVAIILLLVLVLVLLFR